MTTGGGNSSTLPDLVKERGGSRISTHREIFLAVHRKSEKCFRAGFLHTFDYSRNVSTTLYLRYHDVCGLLRMRRVFLGTDITSPLYVI